MIWPQGKQRVYAYGAPCDMRKSFNTLSGLVSSMGQEITHGDVFLFVSKNKKRAKVLWFDGTGLCLMAKRLDQGVFAALWGVTSGALELSPNELRLFIEGCKVVGKMQLSPSLIDIDKASHIKSNSFR